MSIKMFFPIYIFIVIIIIIIIIITITIIIILDSHFSTILFYTQEECHIGTIIF